MEEIGSKADIEAVYEACGGPQHFVEIIAAAIEAENWV